MVKKVANPVEVDSAGSGRNEDANNGVATPDHETIAQRAYELYCAWGLEDGNDLAHWFEAERQLKDEQAENAKQVEVPEAAG